MALLKEWASKFERDNPGKSALAYLMDGTRYSSSTLEKIFRGTHGVGPQGRLLLALSTGLDESELFPLFADKESA